jgi:hypothetical protein
MAFGIKKHELQNWKNQVDCGEIAIITHYWYDLRFPDCKTVTKVGCMSTDVLAQWGKQYDLKEQWIHQRSHYSHFDLLGNKQIEILKKEGCWEQLTRFNLLKKY